MVLCFVPFCVHKSDREQCKMFRFPTNEKRKALWIKLVRYSFCNVWLFKISIRKKKFIYYMNHAIFSRRADREPNVNSRVCSCHFEEGKDFPTIFERNKDQPRPFKEIGNIEQRKRKRR